MNLSILCSWPKSHASQIRNKQNLFFLSAIVVAIGLCESLPLFADSQECNTNLAAYDCGGWGTTPDQERCFPEVVSLQVTVKSVDTVFNPPFDPTINYKLQVSFSARGFHINSSMRPFRARLELFDGYGFHNSTAWSTDVLPPNATNICVKVGGESCIPISTSPSITAGWVRLTAEQVINWNIGYCGCERVYNFALTNIEVGDTLVFMPPRPSELGQTDCQSQVGDPINVTNGNMFLEKQDFVLPSDLGMELDFKRYYNSFATNTMSMLGPNWRHSLEYYLERDDSTGDYTLTECTGRQVVFKRHDLHYGQGDSVFTTFSPPYQTPYRFYADAENEQYVVRLLDDRRLFFERLGSLDSIVDLSGQSLKLSYESDILTSVENASGRRISFRYQGGRLSEIVSSEDETLVAYEYDSTISHLSAASYPDQTWEEYEYDIPGNHPNAIVQVNNSEGTPRYYSYDSGGRAVSTQRESNHERVEINWTWPDTCGCTRDSEIFDGTVTYQTDELVSGYSSIWAPTDSQRVVIRRQNADCPGCASEFEYDASGLKKTVTHPNGRNDRFYHDSRGNLLKSILAFEDPDSQVVYYDYDSLYNLPTEIFTWSEAKPGQRMITTFVRDSKGNPTQIIETGWRDTSTQFSETTQFTYNSNGQLIKYDGPRSDVPDTVTFAYYAGGDLQKVTQQNGDYTIYGERDELGRRPFVVTSSGDTTRFLFDTRGRLTKLTLHAGTADSALYSYTYSTDGKVIAATSPAGGEMSFNYDARGYLTQVLNLVDSSYISLDYDSLGQTGTLAVYSPEDVVRLSRVFSSNAKHQLLFTAGPYIDTAHFAYDDGGDLDEITDPLGNKTVNRYDLLHRIKASVSPWSADSSKVSLTYDSRGNVTMVVDPDGEEYTYRYDDKNRLTYVSCAVTGETRYRYDAAGNLTWVQNASGDSILCQYDSLNRLTKIDYLNDPDIHFFYDGTKYSYGLGKLFKDSTSVVVNTYRYDSKGRLYQEIRKFPPDSTVFYTTSYTYDKNDNLKTLSYPSGNVVEYFYDAAGNCSGARTNAHGYWSNIVDSVAYAPFGEIEKWRLGNGIKMTNRHNLRYEIDTISTDTTNLVEWFYTYDGVGNISSIANLLDTLKTRQFSYDELSRLVFARCADFPDSQQTYRYTLNGNRDTVIVTNATTDTTVYTYADNKLVSLSDTTQVDFTYDLLGNVTKVKEGNDSTMYDYSDAGTLISATNATTTTFGYDAFRRRVKRTITSNIIKYFYSPSGQILSERLSPAGWIDYVYLNGKLLALFSKPEPAIGDPGGGGEMDSGDPPPDSVNIFYFHNDHLGTPWFLTNEQQGVVWSGEHYPFGEVYDELANILNNHRFPGQYVDRTTGLNYNWHRYYSPEIGRYYQADPIGLNGGVNVYSYVRGNPLRRIDPNGLDDDPRYGTVLPGDVAPNPYNVIDVPVSSPDPSTWPMLPSWFVDASAGFGDVLLLDFGDDIRELLDINSVNRCSNAYNTGQWVGFGATLATGVAGGIRAAGAKTATTEFSHWIPRRWLKSTIGRDIRSIWNGNWVTPFRHTLTDRYRFLKGMTLDDKLPFVIRVLDRTPRIYVGTGVGITWGLSGMSGDCGCKGGK